MDTPTTATQQRNNSHAGNNRISVESFVSVPNTTYTKPPPQNYNRPKVCPFCAGPHNPFECKLPAHEKFIAVRQHKLCSNCLGPHFYRECQNLKRCRTCDRFHHTSLHDYFANSSRINPPRNNSQQHATSGCAIAPQSHCTVTVRKEQPPIANPLDTENTHAIPSETQNQEKSKPKEQEMDIILLETGKVKLLNDDKETIAGVLIDRGSMVTYISKEAATRLGLKPHRKRPLNVNGFAGHVTKRIYDAAYVNVKTNDGIQTIEALISNDEIVKPITQIGWDACQEYNYIAGLDLANDFSDRALTIDLMLGVDFAFEFLENRMVKGDGPTVQFSNIGCFVSGPLRPKMTPTIITTASSEATPHKVAIQDNELAFLESYLQANALHTSDVTDTEYDQKFKDEYLSKIQYKDSRYYVPLPWRTDHPELPNNLETCKSRIKQVMGRLRKLDLIDAYVNVMRENIEKDFVSEISHESTADTEGYYVPHFPVLRDSETTPVRIVFDASSGSPSLNDCLYEGPNMLQDLNELLMRFRVAKIGLTADIARAFLSVRLMECDRKYVKFLWYKDNDVTKEIVPYACNTIIFGNVSSPFALAITLQKHLAAHADSPVAKDMQNKLYVDNLLTGVDTDEEGLAYYHESRGLLNAAAMHLRQWGSNSEKLTNQIQADGLQTKSNDVGVLGLKWATKSDKLFIAKKELPLPQALTKRIATSLTASVFDPLGLIAPMTVPAKAFVNKLWKQNSNWDENLSSQDQEQWIKIAENLRQVNDVKLPRWLGANTKKPLEIIIFCDACPTTALGCVAYAKQDTTIALLGSKNKVISSKNAHQTVPKLELMAMVMGVEFGDTLRKIYAKDYPAIEITYTTDSEIALYWLKSGKKLKPFVQNRVNIIREKSNPNSWYHVATDENSADILSRGATHEELQRSSWITGPKWLTQPRHTWPLKNIQDKPEIAITLAAGVEMANVFQPASQNINISNVIDINRFSSLQKLLRVTALVTRAFRSGPINRSMLTAEDVNKAEKLWISHIQTTAYADVLTYFQCLHSGRATRFPKRQAIINQLGLFIDKSNIIRCGGRISAADVAPDRKYPILLPHRSYLTTLVIQNAHHTMVHYGVGSTMAHLRNKYWITSMRASVKKVIGRCVICKKVAGRPYLTPVAPPLPEFRINDLTAFKSTAVDFTSHLYVRVNNTTQKVYVCLFTCCTTRGVHLEITPDLTVESFIRSFRRFTSTHSTPSLIYCDNAKTFTGADAELKRLYNIVSSDRFKNHLTDKGIYFKYAPVQASWFAGVHERLIGVTKLALKKTLNKSLVSIDEFQTLIKEIQATINNRPLTYLSADPKELKAITPNNLIYGHDVTLLPNEDMQNESFDPTYAGRDKLEKIAHKRAQLLETFRTRFYDEYLARLRQQHQYELRKQNAKSDVIKLGDVVLVHDKDTPRRKWKLGIIMELHPGIDGLTRSALVRTATGKSNRAIGKLYPLELNVDELIEQTASEKTVLNRNETSRPKRSTADLTRLRIRENLDYYEQ
ncbi:uncharacterized protein LOC135492984 [Lineus longissimus]|uniref:uncharacterized protein LOC135492984 n=1 Tax=Lineus longissimus TaxID=88925 RepID=UPI00315DB33F